MAGGDLERDHLGHFVRMKRDHPRPERLEPFAGGLDQTQNFVRLFVAPYVVHEPARA